MMQFLVGIFAKLLNERHAFAFKLGAFIINSDDAIARTNLAEVRAAKRIALQMAARFHTPV